MKQITSNSPGLAWKKLIKEVIKNGNHAKDGNINLLECLNILITIKNPTHTDSVIRKHSEEKMLNWMKNNFLTLEPVENWGYSYGQRILNYQGINQFNEIVKKFKKNIQTKSATVTLSYPPGDMHHSPCVNIIDFKFRNNRLNATVFMRSQDAGKKTYADIICLGIIQKNLAEELQVELGELTIHIASLHIYETDLNDLENKFPEFFLNQLKNE